MKVVCIGSGNVATHLTVALKTTGANIIQIWSRSLDNALVLAAATDAGATSDLEDIDVSADLYLIAVKDDAIPVVSAALAAVQGLVVHTSGATDINVLAALKNYGVLYPLQTFSKNRPVNFANVPLCIEAGSGVVLEQLKAIAGQLRGAVYEVDSGKRKILHLSAVFACNFVNHLYALGNDILDDHHLDFEMLRPLIMETAEKVQRDSPALVQTGPAIRNDEQTMVKHLELLDGKPQLQEIYQTLSNSIKKTN